VLLAVAISIVVAAGFAIRHGPCWLDFLVQRHPPGVIIHHTATGATANGRPVNAALVDDAHKRRGWGLSNAHQTYHIGYHYLILPDGSVETGRPEWMTGAHCRGRNHYIGIALVGNYSSKANPEGSQQPARPTPAQLHALHSLLLDLINKHGFGPDDVHGHSEFRATECPGDRFPIAEVRRKIEEASR
jgi:N-acetylmuramoyl-L-alanine amidase